MSEEAPDFKEVIPEQYREMGIVKEAQSMDDIFKRVQDLNEYRGNSIRIPSEEAGADQMVEFTQKLTEKVPGLIKIPDPEAEGYQDIMNNVFQQLGRPGDPAGYKVPEPPEGVKMEAEGFEAFGKLAHELGLTQAQFEALAKRELETTLAGQSSTEATRQEVETAIKTEFGQAYEGKTAIIKDFLAKNFPSVKDTPLAEFGVDTCKEFLAMAEKLNAEGGSSIDTGLQGQEAGALTPAEAQAQISEIRGNAQHPYNNKLDPGHKAAMERVRKLYEYAYGKEPVGGAVSMSVTV